jgi:post-segregation antitoxin (ccd killing protein)
MKRVNVMLRIDPALRDAAREAGLNVSALAEEAISRRLKKAPPQRTRTLRVYEGKTKVAEIELPGERR